MQIMSITGFKKKFIWLLTTLSMPFCLHTQTTKILLDPSYNIRSVATEYENNVAFLYCQALRDYCSQYLPDRLVEVTRNAQEQLEQYAAASFSNKINPDIHISVHFTSTKKVPTVAIYYFTWESALEHKKNFKDTVSSLPRFIPISASYKEHFQQSKDYADACYQLLNDRYGESIIIKKPIGCPFKPLAGVIAPAIAIEFDLENLENSELFQEMLLDIIEQIPYPLETA